MKTLLKLTLISGLMLGTSAFADQAKPADANPAPAAGAEPTQATAEGALKIFIKAMKEGNFDKVVELCDPAAEAYNDLSDMAKAFDPKHKNPNLQDEQLNIVKEFFTKPWQNVEYKLIAEQGNRAQYKLSFFQLDAKNKEKVEVGVRTIDLNKIDDKWYVLVTADLMRPAAPKNPAPAAPQEAPAQPAEKPAEKPADAPK